VKPIAVRAVHVKPIAVRVYPNAEAALPAIHNAPFARIVIVTLTSPLFVAKKF
jgi:hypothetical protein